MPHPTDISLSWPVSLLVLATLLSPPLLLIGFLRRRRKKTANRQPDWRLPVIDSSAVGRSFFHRWHPGAKVASLFCYCFLIVSLQSLPVCAMALMVALLAVAASGTPWRRSRQRLAAMSGFLSLLLIILPLTSPTRPDEWLITLSFLPGAPLHGHGISLAAAIGLKACAVALMMEPMLATASLARTLHGFRSLGLPPKLIQILLLSHRYIFVFQEEARRMWRSMRVRGFSPRTNWQTLHTFGNFLGMLFVSSFERTERVFEAMLCRGYTGLLPVSSSQLLSFHDLLKGALWLGFGAALLAVDHYCFPPLR